MVRIDNLRSYFLILKWISPYDFQKSKPINKMDPKYLSRFNFTDILLCNHCSINKTPSVTYNNVIRSIPEDVIICRTYISDEKWFHRKWDNIAVVRSAAGLRDISECSSCTSSCSGNISNTKHRICVRSDKRCASLYVVFMFISKEREPSNWNHLWTSH